MLKYVTRFTAEDKHTYMTSISLQHVTHGWLCRGHAAYIEFLRRASEQLGMLTLKVPEDTPCAQDACLLGALQNQAASSTHDSATIGWHIVLSSKPPGNPPFHCRCGRTPVELYPPVLRYQKWRNSQTVRHIFV